MTYDYERKPADPRVEHTILLATTLVDADEAGTYTECAATVTYPRRPSGAASRDRVPEQQDLRVRADCERYTRVTTGFRMIGMPVGSRRLDIGGLTVPSAGYFSFDSAERGGQRRAQRRDPLRRAVHAGCAPVPPRGLGTVYYWDAGQVAPLPLGQISPAARHHHAEQAVFSDAWRAEVFGATVFDADFAAAGYVPDGHGYWWNSAMSRS